MRTTDNDRQTGTDTATTAAFDALARRKMKIELRKRLRALRTTTPAAACLARSLRIVERLDDLDAFRLARRIALFWPIEQRHEVDLRTAASSIRARGGVVFYPSIDPDTNVMTFREVPDDAWVEERGKGFMEPPHDALEATELDAIVVPALAVDPSGHRIGYGAGYYDRTLPRFAPPAVTIAVAYDFQLMAEVPATETDVAVSWIVTDTRALAATPR